MVLQFLKGQPLHYISGKREFFIYLQQEPIPNSVFRYQCILQYSLFSKQEQIRLVVWFCYSTFHRGMKSFIFFYLFEIPFLGSNALFNMVSSISMHEQISISEKEFHSNFSSQNQE
ncbi:hypothetical protein SK128_024356 [Halocaridina rubra]|uniref:Uncharacterized protein n=1 Tax=Halocaridina rubra TaxID=373956 RepID=A0AAN8WLW3_HALRR